MLANKSSERNCHFLKRVLWCYSESIFRFNIKTVAPHVIPLRAVVCVPVCIGFPPECITFLSSHRPDGLVDFSRVLDLIYIDD